jgi:peptidoglycan glycosyltransferase
MDVDRNPRASNQPERQIAALGRVFALCMLVAAGMLGYWGLVRGPELAARADNPRWIERERRIRRGSILDRQGRPLVESMAGPLRTWERVYRVPEAAPVVGFSSIHLGTGGIEGAYNDELRGQADRAPPSTLVERLRDELMPRASAGVSVTLTLDLELQRAASRALEGRTGAVVLLDVRSGEILAMASSPTFDPNQIEAQWDVLPFSPDKPMLNRATQGLYPPGRIFQTVTLAEAIQRGLAQPDTLFADETGILLEVDPPISCPADPPATSFSLSEAYRWPCSVLFARLGLEIGSVHLADAARRMGVGQAGALPIEVETGEFLQGGLWGSRVTGLTAMGEGEVLVTPLEMALVWATIAADGQRPTPRLVLAVGGEAAHSPSAQPAIHASAARMAGQVLAEAYQSGAAGTDLPLVGGPAGIAGVARRADARIPGAPDHAWFVGYAPADAPHVAVAVIVEHAEDAWGVAAPIGVRMLDRALHAD